MVGRVILPVFCILNNIYKYTVGIRIKNTFIMNILGVLAKGNKSAWGRQFRFTILEHNALSLLDLS